MKKVLLTSAKMFFVLMLAGIFSVSMAYGQDIPEEVGGRAYKQPDSGKMKPPINAGKSSQVGKSRAKASALKPALSPAKASDTISPASNAGAVSPAQASDTISPAQSQAPNSSVRQQQGRTGNMPPDAAGR